MASVVGIVRLQRLHQIESKIIDFRDFIVNGDSQRKALKDCRDVERCFCSDIVIQ